MATTEDPKTEVVFDDFSGMLAGPERVAYKFKLGGEPYDVQTIDLDELAVYSRALAEVATSEKATEKDPVAALESIRAAKAQIIAFIRSQLSPRDQDRFATYGDVNGVTTIVGGEVRELRVDVQTLFTIASNMAEAATGRPFTLSPGSSNTRGGTGGASRGRTSSTAAARKRSAKR